MAERLRCADPDTEGHINALLARVMAVETRARTLEKHEDTRGSPWYKRLLFRLDGWPRAGVIASKPAWRPWRRWYRS